MNKREAQFYDSYVNSTAVHLEQVYGSYSAKKREAYNRCIEIRLDDIYKYDIVNPLRIISHCSDFFSVAWTVETRDTLYLHVITPAKNYFFEVARYE